MLSYFYVFCARQGMRVGRIPYPPYHLQGQKWILPLRYKPILCFLKRSCRVSLLILRIFTAWVMLFPVNVMAWLMVFISADSLARAGDAVGQAGSLYFFIKWVHFVL